VKGNHGTNLIYILKKIGQIFATWFQKSLNKKIIIVIFMDVFPFFEKKNCIH
jgi:hypothetical protein